MLFALSEPLRLNMVRMLAEQGETDSIDLGPELPRSTLTHHTSLLRESGVVFVRAEGHRCMIRLREAALEARFPGRIPTGPGARTRPAQGSPVQGGEGALAHFPRSLGTGIRNT
ncbi:ArsR/SmtB family transcription factor [Streptomyces anulatus]|uniref:ArsR/SmtB family transcription factor n=1 Tax=Streptomyces anulatus TaxID=1892 RepID=UPI0035D7474E